MAIKKSTKRWLGGIFAGLFCFWLGFVGYIDWAMRQPPEVFGHVMAKMPMPAYFLFIRASPDHSGSIPRI
jgi:hypothetical protein